MIFKVIPIDMITPPNYYALGSEPRWTIIDPNPTVLWMQLMIVDALGERRYITATGATLNLTFQRADTFSTKATPPTLVQTAAGLTLPSTVNANDKSLFSLSLTTQSVQTIVSGSVKFTFTEGSSTNTWVQNHMISKQLTAPGF